MPRLEDLDLVAENFVVVVVVVVGVAFDWVGCYRQAGGWLR